MITNELLSNILGIFVLVIFIGMFIFVCYIAYKEQKDKRNYLKNKMEIYMKVEEHLFQISSFTKYYLDIIEEEKK